MNDDESLQTRSMLFEKTVTPKLEGCVVSLCDYPPARPDDRVFFSGTLIEAGGRVGVATCAHAVPGNPQGRVWIIREDGSLWSKGFPGFLNVLRPAEGHPDVAFLEIDPAVMTDYLRGRTPIGPGDIGQLDYAAVAENPVTLTGNVANEVDIRKIGKGDVVRTNIAFLNHHVVPVDSWPPGKRDDVPADPGTDFYLRTIKERQTVLDGEKWYYTNPSGLSGGGIWMLNSKQPGDLVTPSDFKLVGIQSAWDKQAGMLRAMRVESLLELAPFLKG